MLSDNTTQYMEKLGYEVIDQGNEKFRVICKNHIPIGFLKDDQSLQVVEAGKSEEQVLQGITDFVKEYGDLHKVGNSEFEIGKYKNVTITSFYDIDKRAVQYAVYDNGEGELINSLKDAQNAFAVAAGLIQKQPGIQIPFRVRIALKILERWKSHG